ncbi:MAG: hypothetical protein KC684_00550 [Candidatus Omnitrophica bacterium]|nr:hypothetical protein [Candidatus Omnitrophota bacterium]MCA9407096.1 hypothetical protein [Candidatus Omnitrophota bacterium]
MKTNQNSPKIIFESSFIEEAVFLAAKYNTNKINDSIIQKFHEDRENIYQNTTTEERELAFETLYKEYLYKLKISEIFESIISKFVLLHQPNVILYVKKVWSKGQEDTELFVDGDLRTVCIALMVNRILQPFCIQAILRHDLMRICDMLDPKFQYSPQIRLDGKSELENNLIKDRFRILWDMYIDIRLRKKGYSTLKSVEDYQKAFQRSFFFLKNSEREYIYSKLEGCDDLMQIDMINWAQDARSIKTLGEGGLRCPLCDFTCYEPIKDWSDEKLRVAEAVKEEHPQWTIKQGICPQCFDLYSCKTKVKV